MLPRLFVYSQGCAESHGGVFAETQQQLTRTHHTRFQITHIPYRFEDHPSIRHTVLSQSRRLKTQSLSWLGPTKFISPGQETRAEGLAWSSQHL